MPTWIDILTAVIAVAAFVLSLINLIAYYQERYPRLRVVLSQGLEEVFDTEFDKSEIAYVYWVEVVNPGLVPIPLRGLEFQGKEVYRTVFETVRRGAQIQNETVIPQGHSIFYEPLHTVQYETGERDGRGIGRIRVGVRTAVGKVFYSQWLKVTTPEKQA